ncbi:MFS transporter [Solirubrobacter soli]|uniref:MFS transporter n=1 Tax=Solirubrobacter soli TaxID=363832 RepID=UPI00040489F7|nr:MFS transporter [Solirubrobacter soli]
MHHSYEGLDRVGGFSRVRLLAPLRHRDFRLLWTGMCVSLLGDGMFMVAMAWQVYALSNVPTALSLVGIAMAVPTIALLLIGGVVVDRFDRRRVMVAADVTRGLAVGLLALLSLTGAIELWHVVALVAVYGVGAAFFNPAFDAIVPDVLPESDLGQANALDQFVRPLALRLAGPALGGLLVAAVGAGAAFAFDAASFVLSAGVVLSMRARPTLRTASGSVVADIRVGWSFIRGRVWLWATFASAAIAYLLFMGPAEVLLPYVVKNELGGSAADLGIVFAAGGIGSVLCAVIIGQGGLPRRDITFMYAVWTLGTLCVAGYGIANAVWQLMLASFAFNAFETAGTIVWATAKQKHVPAALLGRVSSLDWLISIGLLPLSFALTGPVSGAIGVRETLIGAGVLGAVVTLAALYAPGMRAIEGQNDEPSAKPAEATARPATIEVAM